MGWKDTGYLCQATETFDKFNRPKKTYTETFVYCNKKSVRGVEFYQAQAQGITPELLIEVKEYNNEDHFRFNGKLYRIIRSYSRNNETYELTLTSTLVDNKTEVISA